MTYTCVPFRTVPYHVLGRTGQDFQNNGAQYCSFLSPFIFLHPYQVVVMKSNLLLGCGLTIVSVVLFVVNGVLMQDTVTSDFQNPFSMIWFCHSSMAILWPIVVAWDFVVDRFDGSYVLPLNNSRMPQNAGKISRKRRRRRKVFSVDAIALSVLNMAANWLYMCSSRFNTNAESNAIFQASIAPVYILSFILGLEKPSNLKVVAIAIIIFGVIILTTTRNSDATQHSVSSEIIGDTLAIAASCGYATYVSWIISFEVCSTWDLI